MRYLDWLVPFVALSLVAPVEASAPGAEPTHRAAGAARVWTEGRRLMVQDRAADSALRGEPFAYAIRGVVWSPAGPGTATSPTDANNAAVRRAEFARWQGVDIPLMQAMHVNTVRLVLDPGTGEEGGESGRRLLDALYAAGIRVAMNVDEGSGNLARIERVVPWYRDHPAILMWVLGSEWNKNLYFGAAVSPEDAARLTERAAALVKRLDPNHPVAASLADLDLGAPGVGIEDTRAWVNRICPSVDLWGLNLYRGRSFGPVFAQWAGISGKPMFIGEFGVDAWHSAGPGEATPGHEDEATQADWNRALWREIAGQLSVNRPDGVVLGGFLFEWNDEWWKVLPPGSQETGGIGTPGQPDRLANEEFFGVVRMDRSLRAAYRSMQDSFGSNLEPPRGGR